MFPSKPDLVILPFRAALIGSDIPLTLEQALLLLRKHVPIQIERSQPGLPDAIGWAIFRRTPRKYLYENAPSSASSAVYVACEAFAKPTPFITPLRATMA